jgi:hypothetical protein
MNRQPHLSSLRTFARPALLATALAATLVGCANLPGRDATTTVQERAQARWNALVAGQIDKAYTYTAPSFRAITPYDIYRGSFGAGASWQAADVIDVRCETERCEVAVRLRIQIPAGHLGPITTDAKEVWIQENGQWWLYQKT